MNAFYNEFEPKAAEWLRQLIQQGDLTDGEVDDRDVREIISLAQTGNFPGAVRCHFFAGIGGWDLALNIAGWPADREVWTASLPCQPFSIAGKGRGNKDERHLWPDFRGLVALRRPAIIFGEQTSSKAGRAWLSAVRADLEELGYAVGAADLCAAGIGAPHIRQRLYWVAHRYGERLEERAQHDLERAREAQSASVLQDAFGHGMDDLRMGHPYGSSVGEYLGPIPRDEGEHESWSKISGDGFEYPSPDGRAADALGEGLEGQPGNGDHRDQPGRVDKDSFGPFAPGGWNDVVYVGCSDGKARPLPRLSEPEAEWVADGVSGELVPSSYSCLVLPPLVEEETGNVRATKEARVMRLAGYGNAIVPELAALFVRSVMDVIDL